jgi:integrase/recombinase XerD
MQLKFFNMKAVIYIPQKNATRIKLFIPYECKAFRQKVKQLNSSWWHHEQKLWSVINTEEKLLELKNIFGKNLIIKEQSAPKPIKKSTLSQAAEDALLETEKVLTLKGMSRSTIKTYRSMLIIFFSKFPDRDLTQISKYEIEGFVYQLIKENKISESFQNQLINAIKAYYEHVLGKPREYYEIKRPKKSVSIPNILSEEEILKILNQPTNLKHCAILTTIYSAGLRISELIKLRIKDIHSQDGYIFVKGAKGKKDRKTILSQSLLQLLRQYYT